MPRHLFDRKGLFIPEAYCHRIYGWIKLIALGSLCLFYIIFSDGQCGGAYIPIHIRFQGSRGFRTGCIRIDSVLCSRKAVALIILYQLRTGGNLFQQQLPGLQGRRHQDRHLLHIRDIHIPPRRPMPLVGGGFILHLLFQVRVEFLLLADGHINVADILAPSAVPDMLSLDKPYHTLGQHIFFCFCIFIHVKNMLSCQACHHKLISRKIFLDADFLCRACI